MIAYDRLRLYSLLFNYNECSVLLDVCILSFRI